MTERVVTERLVLEPLTADEARAVVDGDLSGVRPATGWPHEDTADGLRMVGSGAAEAWLVTLGGEVIGDAGTHGPPDGDGDIEVGFGLGEPHRGRRYAAEFVPALARTLLARRTCTGWSRARCSPTTCRRVARSRVPGSNSSARSAALRGTRSLPKIRGKPSAKLSST